MADVLRSGQGKRCLGRINAFAETCMTHKKIGFIGQGWIGKNYANDFEQRGFSVVRYAKEPEYAGTRKDIATCDIVFIAVPTPTTEAGFDDSIVRAVLPLIGKGKTAVIKSTILPGTTESIQKQFPDVFVFHSPEFLTEATAAHDAAHPERNIVGISNNTHEARAKAQEVLDVLPPAPFATICASREAELVKYGGNCWFYTKVVFVNLLYDLAQKLGCSWDVIRDAMVADPRIGRTHLDPIHKSGRGAGGHCFVKDFAAFEGLYATLIDDPRGQAVLKSLRDKNIELLLGSNKDLDLLRETYGDRINEKNSKREEKDMLHTA